MTSASDPTRRHPVAVAVGRVQGEVAAVADTALFSMGPDEAGRTLADVARARAQLAELELRVLAHADTVGVAGESGATSTAAWWSHRTRLPRPEAHRLVRLARALEGHPVLRQAMAAGDVSVEQAGIISRALAELPADDDVTDEVHTQAEEFLVKSSATHAPRELRILGRRILDVVAPEVGEAHEARLLAREECEAEAAASLMLTQDGRGRWHGRFTLPGLQGAALKKALLALSAPQHLAATEGRAPEHGSKPLSQRLGEAFVAYVDRFPVERLPRAGGLSAQLVVTMTLDTLTGGLASAAVDTGEVLSPARARMLACEAGIIPVVLGGDGQALDVGRRKRFHTKAQRIARIAEQVARRGAAAGCEVEGCDCPPGLCHMHHLHPWARGGRTTVRDAMLICPRHHAKAHDPAYTMTRLPTGKCSFHRRT